MKKIFTVQGLFLFSIFHSAAQKIDSALNILATQFPQEKIYIHYDKEYYVAGETIWFKAYIYSEGKPSNISSNFFLQFTGSKGNIIANKKYPALGAVAKGNIDIPDSLPQGSYYIRALTPGMLNNGETFIYKKNIFIFRPTAPATTPAIQSQNVSLQFFPESGNLVDGILTTVGFKAVDQWGTPVEVNGIIRTEDGTTIASFKTFHDGIGKLPFKPQAGKKYVADVETETGKRSYSLPEVQASGVNIKVQDEKGGKKFQLTRSAKDKGQLDNLLLVAEINNHVVYENELSFDEYPSVIGHLVTDSLPSGILHFTVFNKEGMPLAERLSFVDNGEYRSNGDIVSVKTGVEERAENILELVFPDSLLRSCSISVTEASAFSPGNSDNIYSRFLLTSDLKGYINNPAYYFRSQNDSTRQALDNLMLTQGWSRFSWTKILANKFPTKQYTDPYLINISGIVSGLDDKKPVEGGKLNVLLSTEDSSLLTYDIPVKEGGRYLIDSLVIFGRTKIYYTYTDKKGKEKPVSITTDDNVLEPGITGLPPGTPEKYPVTGFEGLIESNIVGKHQFAKKGDPEGKLLENAVVTAKLKRPVDMVNEKYTSEIFRDGGKIEIDNINNPPVDKSMNGLDFILNRISTVIIQNGTFVNRKNFSLLDNKTRSGSRVLRYWEVGLFINEIPADLIQLKILRADQIAMVKFFEAGALGAGGTYPGGAIGVYLNYDLDIPKKKDKSKHIEYEGYSLTKEFYNPDYTNPAINQKVADNRTTLYWNPDVFTDANSKSVKFDFFNNDFGRQFRVVVEGFDSKGRLIHIEKIIGK